ncbi:MAG: hypothetical protein JXA90_10590, partial [Planctomycetes bacterium]|nr:hypothetical protein [Planctomycetota bacterium]
MGRFLRGGFLPLLCFLAGLAAGDLPAADAERLQALVRDRLGVERSSLCELRLPEEAQVPPAAFRVEVELGGRPSTIRLERHFVRGAGFRLLVQGADGEIREAEPPVPRTYRGVVEGSPGSRVAASLLPQGLSAHVVEAEGSAWIVRPLRLLDGAGSRESHVVYSPEDVEPFSCGTRADGPAPDEVEVIEPAREAGALKDRGSGADTKGSCLL